MMQDVRRKSPSHRPRWLLPVIALVLLSCVLAALVITSLKKEEPVAVFRYEKAVLSARPASDVLSIRVTHPAGTGWCVEQLTPGVLTLEDQPNTPVDDATAALLLQVTSALSSQAVLTDNPADYQPLSDFGLDTPRSIVTVAYADGGSLTLRIGGAVSYADEPWLYMTVDGDQRLHAMEKGTAELFLLDKSLLMQITQPVLHSARFDIIRLEGENGALIGEWSLQGAILEDDAADQWQLTQPYVYPADGDALSTLRQHIASLYLGAYVAPADPEVLSQYGLTAPRLTVTVHQAAGDIGVVSSSGVYDVQHFPEETFTLTVGSAMTEDIDYVLWNGGIYTASHYALASLMNINPAATLSPYPVTTAMGNLARLTVEDISGVREYVFTRTEQVASNNDLVTDAAGRTVYDVSLTRNGEAVELSAFEAAYNQLIVQRASGLLPADAAITSEAHTTFTFEDISGDKRTLALVPWDAFHDAVVIDGVAVFYMVKDSLTAVTLP